MPYTMGTVIMTGTTATNNDVCEVIINYNELFPEEVGRKKYLNQCYWKKLEIKNTKDQFDDMVGEPFTFTMMWLLFMCAGVYLIAQTHED